MQTVTFFMFIVVFFVNDDPYALKILSMLTDEDDVISTRIQASIDFPVKKTK